ncbi:MAG TPA: group II intron maturase-specific domain-containing protein [Flavobacteriales bacterium]|nr:group II intron maturase-specific domain-containing protein [Flavobacteriales bacterium]HRE95939.1 group II intron maturase-specific domain-containing protein [Flavobacteriales bacterium]HRJ35707.1 group II intron maturase-specific domain-containing protein [Flavobacteriales bacterium]HRJ38253.1 group II intron maturase-specific domain-containing protein [Flavobacteriales bacterium]
MSFEECIARINEVQRGWINYFQGTSIHGKLRDFDGWLRNRLRYCIWHHWKKPERKRTLLRHSLRRVKEDNRLLHRAKF